MNSKLNMAAGLLLALATQTRAANGLNESARLSGSANWADKPTAASVQLSTRYANSTDKTPWADNTTFVYWGFIHLDGSLYTFGKKFDDGALLCINGQTLINDTYYKNQITATLQLPAGWYSFELRLGQGGGGVGPADGGIDNSGLGIAYKNASHTSWTALADPGDGSFFQTDMQGVPNPAGLYWNGTASDLATLSGWSTDFFGTTAAAALPGPADIAWFSTYWARAYQQPVLSQDWAVSGIVSRAWEALFAKADGTDRTLTLGAAGITVSNFVSKSLQLGADSDGQRINVSLAADQTWTTQPYADLTVNGTISGTAPAGETRTLTLAPANYSVWPNRGFSDGTTGGKLAVVFNGNGYLRIRNNLSTYSGGTVISNGNLYVTQNNALGTGPITLAGGSIQIDFKTFFLTNDLAILSGATFSPALDGWNTHTFSGRISGSGTFNTDSYWWYNALDLSGDNSGFTGTFNWKGSGHARGHFRSPLSGSAAAVWNLFNTGTDSDNYNGSLAFSGGTIHLGALNGNTRMGSSGANTVVVGERNEDCVWGGTSEGARITFQKEGSATFAITNAAAYSGGTKINAGTLLAGHAAALGTGPIAFGGGTLRYAPGVTTDWSAQISNSTAAITIDDGGHDVSYFTPLSSSNVGGLLKKGSGTLFLNAKPAYQGGTTVEAGALVVMDGLDAGALTLAGGAKLLIAADPASWTNGATPTLLTYSSLTGTLDASTFGVTNVSRNTSVQITYGNGTITATVTTEPLVWNGTDGAGWLDSGAWTGTITGNPHTFGDWDLATFDGTSFGAAVSGTSTVTIASDVRPASLAFAVPSGFGYRLTGAAITGYESLNKSGEGALILANTNAFIGELAVNAGEVVLAGGGVASTNVSIAAGARLAVESPATLAIPGTLTGSGELQVRPGASLALTNAVTIPSIRNDGALELATEFNSPALATRLYGTGLVTKTRNVQLAVKDLGYLNGLTGGLRIANGSLYIQTAGALKAPLTLSTDEYRRNENTCNLMVGADGQVTFTNVTVAGSVPNTVSLFSSGSAIAEFVGTFAGDGALELYCYWWQRPYYLSADASDFTGSVTLGGRVDSGWGDNLRLLLANPAGLPLGCVRFRPTSGKSGDDIVYGTSYLEWNPPASAGDVTVPIGEVQTVFDDGQAYRPTAANAVIKNEKSGTTATFAIGGCDTDSRFEGTIKNGSGVTALSKVGSDILTLPAAAVLTYTGATTVEAGTLELDAALLHSSITVKSGATLSGVGAVSNAASFASGSILAPGTNGVGRLTFAAAPAFGAGSTLLLNAKGGAFATGLNVKTALNLSGVTLRLAAGSEALDRTKTYAFASCAGVTGKPAIDIAAPNGYSWTLDYANGSAFLRLAPDGTRVYLR